MLLMFTFVSYRKYIYIYIYIYIYTIQYESYNDRRDENSNGG